MKKDSKKRCPWGAGFEDKLMLAYHDKEWGRPVRNDRKIFEFLTLEAFQAGLSWRTVLHKRENFRKAFADFEPGKVEKFGPLQVKQLLKNDGISRNRGKIEATINNARRFLEVQKEFGTFSKYMWSWVNGKPVKHRIRTMEDYVPYDDTAVAWAKDLKRRRFKYLGTTVIYAHMQATGMVNDHSMDCFRR
jgi:DNA-3-methyladenine glycosylase I